ncbi:MAG: hypothetical protein KY429_05850 [Actinobacteria bacterium]|nr:hypothetical protein [Actinomycetota bacterium]
MLVASGCENRVGDSYAVPPPPSSPKVVLIGIAGITWEDLTAVEDPYLSRIISNSVIGNMSVRVTNNSADAYATLGAAQRTETDGSAAWAFNRSEEVENGSGLDLWSRRTGSPLATRTSGAVVLSTIAHLVEMNHGKAFDAVVGLLGSELENKGLRAAVVANADLSLGSLPAVLPSVKRMQDPFPPETGIHRESALAAINSEGAVAEGDVSRGLLEKDPESPFGIRTNSGAMLDAFRTAYEAADLIVVETGETARADLYTEGLSDETALRMRRAALREVLTDQMRPIVDEVGSEALVIIFAPTTPGGPEERGQLRPVILTGAGINAGLAVTRSTRRAGIITVPDLSATIARHLGLTDDAFGAGHAVRMSAQGESQAEDLVERNTRAVVHDAVRAPVSIAIILLHLALYVLAVYQLRRGALNRWMQILLLIALAFPLASFASSTLPGPITVTAAVAVIIVVALVLGSLSQLFSRSSEKAATILLAATALFFFIDLTLGARAQLDSVLGYTSVAAGRFFGLGNLGFALFSSVIVLLAAVVGDRWSSAAGGRTKRSFWTAVPLVVLAIVWIGHPALGSDVGGVLTMIPALVVFVYALLGRRISIRHIPSVVLITVLIALIFGMLDLARPADERTHLGDFLSELARDPTYLFLVIRRKLGLAISLTFSTRWGLAVPGALAVLVWLYGRARGQFRQMLEGRDALRAGLHALFTAALVGSIVNDSGIAVAGMMLAVATPWALLTASTNEARITG